MSYQWCFVLHLQRVNSTAKFLKTVQRESVMYHPPHRILHFYSRLSKFFRANSNSKLQISAHVIRNMHSDCFGNSPWELSAMAPPNRCKPADTSTKTPPIDCRNWMLQSNPRIIHTHKPHACSKRVQQLLQGYALSRLSAARGNQEKRNAEMTEKLLRFCKASDIGWHQECNTM